MRLSKFHQSKYLLIGISFILLLMVVITGKLLFFPKSQIISPLETEPTVLAQSTAQPELLPPENFTTLGILLLGYGGAGHEGGFLTDAIQILYFDFEKAVITLISIPRDLWTKLPNGRETKINAAITSSVASKNESLILSGAPTLKSILSEITGLKINYFIGIDFVGFQRAIGINLKGIDVEVGETLDDPWYPIQGEELNTCGKTPSEVAEVSAKYSGFELEKQFPCRYEYLRFTQGTRRMEGGDALKYIRSRHGSNDGDISRGRRQQEVFDAIRKKLLTLRALDNLPGFFSELAKHTQTDINLEIVKFLSPAIQKARDFKLVKINLSTINVLSPGTASNGQFILIPKSGIHNWKNVQEFISNQ